MYFSIVLLGLLATIGYSAATSEVLPVYAKFGIDEDGSRMIGGILIMVYILIISGFAGIALGWISKLVR